MERAVENVNPENVKHDYTRISDRIFENKKKYRRAKNANERCFCFLSNVIVSNRRRGEKNVS